MAGITTAPTLDTPWNAYAGDRNEELIQFLTPDDTPWDITGAEITASARASASDPLVALTATVTIVDAINGMVRLGWDGEAIRTLLAGAEKWTGVWDLQILEAGQTLPETKLRGVFTATHDVTWGAT